LRKSRAKGFTLVELMIVIIILAVIATVSFSFFRGNSDEAKVSSTLTNLRILSEAIDRYYLDHNATYPGTIGGVTNWSNFVIHMTQTTNRDGSVKGPYGPYIKRKIPPNSLVDSNTGTIKRALFIAGSSYGWYYDHTTGQIWANSCEEISSPEIAIHDDIPPAEEPEHEPDHLPIVH